MTAQALGFARRAPGPGGLPGYLPAALSPAAQSLAFGREFPRRRFILKLNALDSSMPFTF
jgi:hypothetical protein